MVSIPHVDSVGPALSIQPAGKVIQATGRVISQRIVF